MSMITITTTDIVLSAAAKTLGFKIVKIERFGSKGEFTIELTQEFLDQYDLGQVKCEPTAFNSNIKGLTTAARRGSDPYTR